MSATAGEPPTSEADVETLLHPELAHGFTQVARGGVDEQVGTGPLRQLQPGVRQVGHGDVPGTDVTGDGRGHDADRPRPGDDDVLAREGEGQGGVHGIAQGVEDRTEVGVDVVVVDPGIARRDDDVVGEGAVAVDAHPDGVDAQVPSPGAAVAAGAADDVALAGDPVADAHARHVAADLVDDAVELVTDDLRRAGHGRCCPVVPPVQVQVGAAQARSQDTDADVVVAGVRLGDVGELQTGARTGLGECSHASPVVGCGGDRGHDSRPCDEGECSPWSSRRGAHTVESP